MYPGRCFPKIFYRMLYQQCTNNKKFVRRWSKILTPEKRRGRGVGERENSYLYKRTKDPTPILEKTCITPSAMIIWELTAKCN